MDNVVIRIDYPDPGRRHHGDDRDREGDLPW